MGKNVFNGAVKIKVIEAENLKATDYSTRIFSNSAFLISPYIHLDIDDVSVGRTITKHRSQNPAFNEEFNSEIHSGYMLNITVFHDSALPPDEFVANCSMSLYEIKTKTTQEGTNSFWIDLEPSGRLYLAFELNGSFKEGKIIDFLFQLRDRFLFKSI
jgi:novel protein kinase C epsilon type